MTDLATLLGGDLTPRRIADEWLAGLGERTRAEYAKDLRHLADFLQLEDGNAARVILESRAQATRIAMAWRASMVEGDLSPSTINRRMSALKGLIRFARILGVVDWAIEVLNYKLCQRPDLTSITWEEYQSRLEDCTTRERAILTLMGDRGLRRSEVSDLRLCDVSEDGFTLRVKRKGYKLSRQPVVLAQRTRDCLMAWGAERRAVLKKRKPWPYEDAVGWVFPGYKRGPITPKTVYRLCWKVMGVRPHALRHLACTQGLDVTNGDVRSVQQFMGHASPATTMVYDDARRDLAGEVARRMLERQSD